MKTDKILTRKCIASMQIIPVEYLVRFDYQKQNNTLTIDQSKTKKGRGAYFLPTIENWAIIKKKRALNRSLRANITLEQYENLEAQLKELIWAKNKPE